ncbi:MAG: VWA domain-containing protein [Planctomycetes bacterium]|nr:VWA domain-containing protein [Planctomycetota bacterium]MCW8136714.1 VWA domain-containing protein [Planctomycetota bacterium]
MNTILKTMCITALSAGCIFAGSRNADACITYEEHKALQHNLQAEEKPAEKPKAPPPKIQLAILLDTSGSMDGLIDQARTQIWKLVNEFAFVKQGGVTPEFELALYEYGKSSIPAEEGYLRQLVGFSTDLDKVSEELFKLTTNGGSEHCGQVIKAAVEGLAWSKVESDYKAIFIAGNEPFTQGPVDYREACKLAISKGIIVNTLHCGSYDEGVQGKWLEGAQLADGSYMSIDHNTKVAHIEAPQDKEIIEMGEKINGTYIRYGKDGNEGAQRQEAQDKNADDAGQGANVNRALAKGKEQYRNSAWDAIDAIDEGRVKIEDMKKEDLPEELRKMTTEELKEHIDKKRTERKELREKLAELEKARNKYVAEKRREMAANGDTGIDEAMIKAIREQAGKRNFKNEG